MGKKNTKIFTVEQAEQIKTEYAELRKIYAPERAKDFLADKYYCSTTTIFKYVRTDSKKRVYIKREAPKSMTVSQQSELEANAIKRDDAYKKFNTIKVGDEIKLTYAKDIEVGQTRVDWGEVIQKTNRLIVVRDVLRKHVRENITVGMLLTGHVIAEVAG